MTGIESIARGKVSHSCCRPRRRQGAGSSKRREPSSSPPAGFASSGLRLHLEFKNTQGQNSPGSRRLARAQPQGSAVSINGGGQMPATIAAVFYFPVVGMPNFSRTGELFPESAAQEHATRLFKQPFATACSRARGPGCPRCCPEERPAAKSGKGRGREQMCREVRPQRRVWETLC